MTALPSPASRAKASAKPSTIASPRSPQGLGSGHAPFPPLSRHRPRHSPQRILEHPFAVISAVSDGQPVAAHAPVLPSGEGEALSLRFHLSVANPVTKALLAGSPVLAVFTGPHAYVSPDWYGLEDQVPTWNYISVEAAGPVTRLDDAAMRQLIDDLSDHFEADLAPKPVWKTAKTTPRSAGGAVSRPRCLRSPPATLRRHRQAEPGHAGQRPRRCHRCAGRDRKRLRAGRRNA